MDVLNEKTEVEMIRAELDMAKNELKIVRAELDMAKTELERSKTELGSYINIIDGSNEGTFEWNYQTGEQKINKRWAEIIGYKLSELEPVSVATWKMYSHSEDMEKVLKVIDEVLEGKMDFYSTEFRMRHKDGSWKWIKSKSKVNSWTEDGKALIISGTHTDITARKDAEEALSISQRRLKDIIDFLPDATLAIDREKRVIIWNKAIERMTGVPASEMIGRGDYAYTVPFYGEPKTQFMDLVFNYDEEISRGYQNLVFDGDTMLAEAFCPALYDNKGAWISVKVSPLHDEEENVIGVIESIRDITERKKAESHIQYLSYYDVLTGLYNRRFYEEELKRVNTERNLPLALIMADVNGLKLTNDAFGHQSGDLILKKVAKLIKKECRGDEIVSRIGGDEFVILLPGTTEEGARKLVDRINNALAREQASNNLLSVSLGYAIKTKAVQKMKEVFKEAEDDMYRHKLAESSSMRSKTIDLIINSLYEKNNREMLHSKRVSEISREIAVSMGFGKEDVNKIAAAGLMHDIGKIGIKDAVLNKEGKLSDYEWQEIKKHSETGYRILSSVNEFSEIAEYVLSHHERWDGKGYPKGIKELEIPIEARIVGIADAYDAMTSKRTYQEELNEEEAVAEIKKCAGQQFDPDVAQCFFEKVLGKIW